MPSPDPQAARHSHEGLVTYTTSLLISLFEDSCWVKSCALSYYSLSISSFYLSVSLSILYPMIVSDFLFSGFSLISDTIGLWSDGVCILSATAQSSGPSARVENIRSRIDLLFPSSLV